MGDNVPNGSSTLISLPHDTKYKKLSIPSYFPL